MREPMQVVECEPVDAAGCDDRSQSPEPTAARGLTLPPRLACPVDRCGDPRRADDAPTDPDRKLGHDPMVAAVWKEEPTPGLEAGTRSLRVSLPQVTAEELDGASVRELLSLGVVLGPITLHEPVLRPRIDVRLLTLRFGGRRDELVVLGEVALVRHAVRRVVHVAVDRHERGNVFA